MMSKDIATSSWASGVTASDKGSLTELALNIGERTTRMACDSIEIGHLLNRARKFFVGDKEFGQWRMECTVIGSARMATAMMAVANKFQGKAIVDQTSFSVLQELLPASDATIAKVKSSLDAGEKVTSKDARAAVKEDKPIDINANRVDLTPAKPVEEGPAEEYEMIAVTKDELDVIIDALRDADHPLALEIADRLDEDS